MDEKKPGLSRRIILKGGAMAGGALVGMTIIGSRAFMAFAQDCVNDCAEEFLPEPTNCGIKEVWATTPFIATPFIDVLPVPKAMKQGFRQPVGLASVQTWEVRRSQPGCVGGVVVPADMANCKQDSYGGTHQLIPADINAGEKPGVANARRFPLEATPLVYHIRLQVAAHSFTSSKVVPIDKGGRPLRPRQLAQLGIALDADGLIALPKSTIYGYNGTFPGPMINVEYGKPVIVRFENDLDVITDELLRELGLSQVDERFIRSDFGVPQFLTHLHNGHTAPESDGNPHYMKHNECGYVAGDFSDNLYLNWPAGGDPKEIQSFLWFHDHRMHHTGANVYKGMVGLFPMYDPGVEDPENPGQPLPGTGLDPGDETKGLRLPGVRVDNQDGTFDVKYDIPMAFYDVRLDDGLTPHKDFRIGDPLIAGETPTSPTPPPVDKTLCGATHPEQWGKTFFRYHPNHGFVGDVFTINGKAFPVLNVYKRRYRLRWLGASVARVFELALMTSAAGPQARPGTLGQWQIPDGVLWKPNALTQIASMGGLLPRPLLRDSIQIWPATRREVIVDFTDVEEGQVIYLTNVLEMKDGRKAKFLKPGTDLDRVKYKVPVLKIVVGGAPPEEDQSVMPNVNTELRLMPPLPTQDEMDALPHKTFTLERSGKFGKDAQWLINGLPFDPLVPLTTVKLGKPEIWILRNKSGGWIHPMHMHQEEHTVLERVGSVNVHPEDIGKGDTVNLDPSETVTVYRNFRTFTGPYVAHCHNLAHEDHSMMFGWTIEP
jgi:FtsP/CotA-like multicopper oxidase with cupredoxin domain